MRGVLPAVLAAKGGGWKAAVVPVENLPEASLVDGIEVWGVRTLAQLQGWLGGSAQLDERISGVGSGGRAARRIWPTWWGRPRRVSPSRSPPPARIT